MYVFPTTQTWGFYWFVVFGSPPIQSHCTKTIARPGQVLTISLKSQTLSRRRKTLDAESWVAAFEKTTIILTAEGTEKRTKKEEEF